MKKIWIRILSWFWKKESKKKVTVIPVVKREKEEQLDRKIIFRFVDELSENIKPDIIYIVGEGNFHWMLGFLCPCGCRDLIHLNLLESASPQWEYKIHRNNTISISPSIWKNSGCKSHFLIKSSKVIWVEFKKI